MLASIIGDLANVLNSCLAPKPSEVHGLLIGPKGSGKTTFMLHLLGRGDEVALSTGSLFPRSPSQMWPHRAVDWVLPLSREETLVLREVSPLEGEVVARNLKGVEIIVFVMSATSSDEEWMLGLRLFHEYIVPHALSAKVGVISIISNSECEGARPYDAYSYALYPPNSPLGPSASDPRDNRILLSIKAFKRIVRDNSNDGGYRARASGRNMIVPGSTSVQGTTNVETYDDAEEAEYPACMRALRGTFTTLVKAVVGDARQMRSAPR